MTDTTPRCYGHVFDPAHLNSAHGNGPEGWPAHVWADGQPGNCRHCPEPVTQGDRYVCVPGGILHATCVAALDDAILGIPTATGDE